MYNFGVHVNQTKNVSNSVKENEFMDSWVENEKGRVLNGFVLFL